MNSTQTMSPIGLMIERLRNLHKNAVFRRSVLLAFLLYLSPVMGMILELALIRVFSAGAVLDSFRALMTFMLMGQGQNIPNQNTGLSINRTMPVKYSVNIKPGLCSQPYWAA